MSMVKFDFKGNPLSKLIEVISASLGRAYNPTAIKNEADAEAYKIKALAKANAEAEQVTNLIKMEGQLDLLDRLKDRLTFQEVERQVNIENISGKAIHYLPESASEKPVDKDWRTRFFSKAQDISNEEMQEIWAKILAEEVAQPGKFSLRTLDVLSNLTSNEANIFNKVCGLFLRAGVEPNTQPIFIRKRTVYSYESDEIPYGDILLIQQAGLLHPGTSMAMEFPDDGSGVHLEFTSNGVQKFLRIKAVNAKVVDIHTVGITTAGEELSRIINKDLDLNFLDYVIKAYKTEGYDVGVTDNAE